MEWLKACVFAFAVVWIVNAFLFSPVKVKGASMMPTVEEGERVIVNKIGKSFSDFERSDIIVFEESPGTYFIKRVIGIPGDTIEYKNDVLYVNGEKVEEPYLDTNKEGLVDTGTLTEDFTLYDYTGEQKVPEGQLFVLGDNRRKSSDSRDSRVGFIEIESVLGTTNIVSWPVQKIRIINN
ncbi:signal peptidase I [Lysinibacillus sp. 54212]|uniref:signal peptidase I n=1 Tax=Lysinibacillus sp. 54212 TaxID=3119829 RepID=UPI003FA560FC